MKGKFLIVNFSQLHLRLSRSIQDNYISIQWDDLFYFTNYYTSLDTQQHSITLNHNIVLPITPSSQPTLILQCWENHMIIFEHMVDLSELKSRLATRKKIEIRPGEILDFTVHLLNQRQFHLSAAFNSELLQHFLLLHQMALQLDDKKPSDGPTYLIVHHDTGSIIVPILKSVVVISLPSKVLFQHFKNGKIVATSKTYSCQQLGKLESVRMIAGEDKGYDLQINALWGTNLWRDQPERSMLLDSQQILIYEIEVRLQFWKQVPTGLKLKLNYGNKFFQLNGQSNNSNLFQFARIIYFVMKSDDQQFSFVIERNQRPIGKVTIGAEELLSHHLNTIRRKIIDLSGNKSLASLRFKCEKAKQMSLPQNNSLWKKKGVISKTPAIYLEFTQLSVQAASEEICGLIIKSEQQQLIIPQLPNFNFYRLETEIPEAVILTLHQQGNIYLKLINSGRKDDFLGIAILNYKQLRLGNNILTIPFFKQQEAVCLLHLIVNKVVPWPFVRGLPTQDSNTSTLLQSLRVSSVSVILKQLKLSALYYTYQYDRKGQIYCIVEVNKVKKVIFLEGSSLTFTPNNQDILRYSIAQNDSLKLRLTILACDQGVQEQVICFYSKKFKGEQLTKALILIERAELSNDYGILIGHTTFQLSFSGMDFKKGNNSLKKGLRGGRIQESIQREVDDKKLQPSLRKRQRYASIKLPQIKDPRQERLKKMAIMLEARRKQMERKPKKRVESERRAEPTQQNNMFQNYTTLDPLLIQQRKSFRETPQITPEIVEQRQPQIINNELEIEERMKFNNLPQMQQNQFAPQQQVLQDPEAPQT